MKFCFVVYRWPRSGCRSLRRVTPCAALCVFVRVCLCACFCVRMRMRTAVRVRQALRVCVCVCVRARARVCIRAIVVHACL